MPTVAGLTCNRFSSWSGQRSFPLVVEPRPSVSESPTMATPALCGLDHTSAPLRKYQCSTVAAPVRSWSSTWFPATMYEVVREPG
jgi:hypothetical protein